MHQHGVGEGSEELLYHVKQKRVQVVTAHDIMAKNRVKLEEMEGSLWCEQKRRWFRVSPCSTPGHL